MANRSPVWDRRSVHPIPGLSHNSYRICKKNRRYRITPQSRVKIHVEQIIAFYFRLITAPQRTAQMSQILYARQPPRLEPLLLTPAPVWLVRSPPAGHVGLATLP